MAATLAGYGTAPDQAFQLPHSKPSRKIRGGPSQARSPKVSNSPAPYFWLPKKNRTLAASGSLPIYREGRGWKLAEDARMEILPVRFQLEEAVAVYLAARLLLRHAGESSPAIQRAVSKMSTVVPADLRTACARLTERVDAKNDPTAAFLSLPLRGVPSGDRFS